MVGVVGRAAGFGRLLQSDIVLRIARVLYLLMACVCLALAVVGVIIALLAQAATLRDAHDQPVPAVHAPQAEPIAIADVQARLAPPQNVRFVPELLAPDVSLQEGAVLGHFDADTPNGLANYPADFDIVGGRDAALFTLGQYPRNWNRTALIATAALAQQVNAARAAPNAPDTFSFAVRAIARDGANVNSPAADVSVTLAFGMPNVAPAPGAESPNALQQLAREIALVVDPQRTDIYFDVQRRALQLPQRCGASGAEQFVGQYRRAFDGVRTLLNDGNLNLFFIGVCEAWSNARARGQALNERERAAAEQVEASNLVSRMAVETQKLAARGVRNLAIGAVVSAFACFLIVALFLAFLAMEGHSRALRDAVDALADQAGAKARNP